MITSGNVSHAHTNVITGKEPRMAPEVINAVIDHLPENFGLSVSGSVEDFSMGILKR